MNISLMRIFFLNDSWREVYQRPSAEHPMTVGLRRTKALSEIIKNKFSLSLKRNKKLPYFSFFCSFSFENSYITVFTCRCKIPCRPYSVRTISSKVSIIGYRIYKIIISISLRSIISYSNFISQINF